MTQAYEVSIASYLDKESLYRFLDMRVLLVFSAGFHRYGRCPVDGFDDVNMSSLGPDM